MTDKEYGLYLIKLIFSVLCDKVPPEFKDDNFDKLYAISEAHNLSNIAYLGLAKLEILPEKQIIDTFYRAYKKALAKEAGQQYELEAMLSCFEEKRIFHMPLKGSIMKAYYKSPDLRTMGDIDILIKQSDIDTAKEIMLSLGYKFVKANDYSYAFIKSPYIYVELHTDLISNFNEKLFSETERIKNNPLKCEGYNFRYKLSDEDFYIYTIIHLAKHFKFSGTGLRSVIDIFIFNRYFKDKLNKFYIDERLSACGLLEFSKKAEYLGRAWAGEAEYNTLCDEMTEYILRYGLYGSFENHEINDSVEAKRGNRGGVYRIIELFFPNASYMKRIYPYVEKHKYLLPFLWIDRGAKRLIFHSDRVKTRISAVGDKQLDNRKEFLERCGL